MAHTELEEYYNKFNEDKRLLSRHGQVEYNTTMYYIREYLNQLSPNDEAKDKISIVDIGAGTGRYSLALAKEGYNVTAVELVQHNLGLIKKHVREELVNGELLSAFKGDARSLKRFKDNSFDMAIILGPMYHLHSVEDKQQVIKEASRIVKPQGQLFIGYVMADYALVKYGFMEHHAIESLNNKAFDDSFNILSNDKELYDYVRLTDIDEINGGMPVERVDIFSPDGPTDYMRFELNHMSAEEFALLMEYQIKNAKRQDLLGAGSHVVDVLRNIKADV